MYYSISVLLLRTDMATCQLSLLVLVLCSLSVSAQIAFLSIDCGSSSASYRDGNLINWSGDDNYTSTGESRVVESRNSISRVMNSLRVFTNGRNKNCYHIDSVNQGRVLLRASFHYGNYDDRSRPPTFDLQFDGNHWAEVETSSSGSVSYEVIYYMKRDSISVCLAQTRRNEFPFISALEIRGLAYSMYGDYVNETLPLFLYQRHAYGLNSTVRYGDDPYDRIWNPGPVGNGYTVLTGNTTFREAIPDNRPPPAILQNALTAVRPNSSIVLPTGLLPPKVYFTWYFTEVTRLGSNDTRSFIIAMNDEFSDPIEPPYQNCSQWYGWSKNVTTNYTVSLIPTNVSTLPPLINAMEVYKLGDELTNGTNKDDLLGLNSLQGAFSVLESWTGDPCLPATFNWEWIECSNDTEPRVTALLLGSFGLTGALPSFALDALRTIDLHNNSLSGRIPDFLGTLPDLTELNLADNQFTGSIPDTLSRRNGLNLVVTGNTGLCTSSNSSSCPTSTSPPPQNPQSPRDSSATSKFKNYLPIMFDTTIASLTVIFFIVYRV